MSIPILPDKSKVLNQPPRIVKRWVVYVGTTKYQPLTLIRAIRLAREQMWGRSRVITLEPVIVQLSRRNRKSPNNNAPNPNPCAGSDASDNGETGGGNLK